MKGRYPLEALAKLRQRAVDERVREVAGQVRRAEQAAVDAHNARRTREAEQDRARAAAAVERERLENGEASVADLIRQGEWARGAAVRLESLAEREAKAAERARAEKREELAARTRLASADADAKAVDTHRERWRRERAQAIEAQEEETAGEAWLSRHLRRGKDGG